MAETMTPEEVRAAAERCQGFLGDEWVDVASMPTEAVADLLTLARDRKRLADERDNARRAAGRGGVTPDG